jgi:hypothetical protein
MSVVMSVPVGHAEDALPQASATSGMTDDQCRQHYSALRRDMEAKAGPIREINGGRPPAAAACQLLTGYGEAEARMIDFIAANSDQCRIPRDAGESIKKTHVATERLREQACGTPKPLPQRF